ncbi:hypothetical protein MNBD_GAMMA10-880 [hydrothermal vent metagenome]|uniref:Uncharacterized protein n=1 Tax=hydrothermal vent metagenome TaxID=652676 RepID=A0A3B0XTH6_9ZZZZ
MPKTRYAQTSLEANLNKTPIITSTRVLIKQYKPGYKPHSTSQASRDFLLPKISSGAKKFRISA